MLSIPNGKRKSWIYNKKYPISITGIQMTVRWPLFRWCRTTLSYFEIVFSVVFDFLKLYGQFVTIWHFKSLDYHQEELEIAEDMLFTCNNNYSAHIRHILQHTGVIWNFYGIFQQRISRSSIGLGQRDKYKRKEETKWLVQQRRSDQR